MICVSSQPGNGFAISQMMLSLTFERPGAMISKKLCLISSPLGFFFVVFICQQINRVWHWRLLLHTFVLLPLLSRLNLCPSALYQSLAIRRLAVRSAEFFLFFIYFDSWVLEMLIILKGKLRRMSSQLDRFTGRSVCASLSRDYERSQVLN